jgi:hypothetical protein
MEGPQGRQKLTRNMPIPLSHRNPHARPQKIPDRTTPGGISRRSSRNTPQALTSHWLPLVTPQER